jgi:hypothetical protein
MLLGIDWFVVEDSRRKAAINVADLLNGHEWRKVGCVVENKLEFRQ